MTGFKDTGDKVIEKVFETQKEGIKAIQGVVQGAENTVGDVFKGLT